ncbi:MAG: rod shape-determining protein MreD [Bacillota bacterium]|nr:rod shape-determining protein MreD [Bacillota bacterium]
MPAKLKKLICFIILFLVFCLQISPFAQQINVEGVTPDLIFISLLVLSLYLKPSEVIAYAFIFGSMNDLLYGKVYGITAILFIGFVCLFLLLNKYIYCESYFTIFLYSFIATLSYESILALVNFVIWGKVDFLNEIVTKILVQCFYNGLLTLPAFAIVRNLIKKRQEVR